MFMGVWVDALTQSVWNKSSAQTDWRRRKQTCEGGESDTSDDCQALSRWEEELPKFFHHQSSLKSANVTSGVQSGLKTLALLRNHQKKKKRAELVLFWQLLTSSLTASRVVWQGDIQSTLKELVFHPGLCETILDTPTSDWYDRAELELGSESQRRAITYEGIILAGGKTHGAVMVIYCMRESCNGHV